MLAVSADHKSNRAPGGLPRDTSCPSIIYTVASVTSEKFKVIRLIEGNTTEFQSLSTRKAEIIQKGEITQLFVLANGLNSLVAEETVEPQDLSTFIKLLPVLADKIDSCDEPQKWNFLLAVLEADRALNRFEQEGQDDQFSEVEAKILFHLRGRCSTLFMPLMGENTTLCVQKDSDLENSAPTLYSLSMLTDTFAKLGWNH